MKNSVCVCEREGQLSARTVAAIAFFWWPRLAAADSDGGIFFKKKPIQSVISQFLTQLKMISPFKARERKPTPEPDVPKPVTGNSSAHLYVCFDLFSVSKLLINANDFVFGYRFHFTSHKAGMDSVQMDRDRANQIIYEHSKNSDYFKV